MLTDFEFRLWIGLITQADDAGRGDARPAIIKGRVFPLRDRVSVRDIDASLHALAAKGCVSLYKVGGKPYFWFPSWAEHQRIRDCKPKYPAPESADDCEYSRQPAASCGLNPIQSEYESESESESKGISRTREAFPPTVEEVAAYCRERGNAVDAQRFVDFYASKGWLVGKNRMKDWKAAVRTWERRDEAGGAFQPQRQTVSTGNPFLREDL